MMVDLRIITPTCRKYERFCAAGATLLDQYWPGHPPQWIINDGDWKTPTTVTTQGNWVRMLAEGLADIRQRAGQPEFVLLVLEDLLPLGAVDVEAIQNALALAQKHGLNQIVFPTYQVRWQGVGEGRFAVFKGHRFTEAPEVFDGVTLHRMNPRLRWYSQTQPAIWRLSHLIELVDQALAQGHECAWGFEFCRNEAVHYLSEYRWPTVWNGWFAEGKINPWVMPLVLKTGDTELRHLLVERAWADLPSLVKKEAMALPKHLLAASRVRLRRVMDRLGGRRPTWHD
jgi:hypothetical protein